MPRLSLTFFGAFQAELNGEPLLHFRSANVQGLLVYLAMQAKRPFPRDTLATLFWPNDTDATAKKNLRQSLYQLRKVLNDSDDSPQPFLLVTRQTVQFNPAADFSLDLDQFLAACGREDWQTAVSLYAGTLLPGFFCDSEPFEAWLRVEREHFYHLALEALERAATSALKQGEFMQVKLLARQQLAIEPWREVAHRQLMLALALDGERAAAVAQYEACCNLLEDELGVEPEAETTAVFEQIRSGKISAERAAQLIAPAPDLPPPFQAPHLPPHFVGRTREIEALAAQLMEVENRSPIALVGMGGAGKTSLAAALAHHLRDQFADGVLWVNTHTSEAINILALWGRAYGYDYSGLADLGSRELAVRSLLATKQTLIVLDNVDEAATVRSLLVHGDRCRVILTTRNLDIASVLNAVAFQLKELSPSGCRDLLEQILGKERVSAEEDAAMEIGHLLHYLPLAVEIAAQRLKSRQRMTLTNMVQRLQDTQHRLGLRISDQAVRASFQVSWDGLDEDLRQTFAAMAVFGGRPFSAAALTAVLDQELFDTEDNLYTLVALSLVNEAEESRYYQHPLLADFAAEKLTEPNELKRRMVSYYLTLAQENRERFTALDPEWENIAAAIRAADALAAWQAVVDFAEILAESWLQYGRYQDATEAYELAEKAAKTLQSHKALADILTQRATINVEQSLYDWAGQRLEEAIKLYYQLEDDKGVATAKYLQGFILYDQGLYADAQELLEMSQALHTELGEYSKAATTARSLSRIYLAVDETPTRAETTASKALEIQLQQKNKKEIMATLRLLAEIEFRKGELNNALNNATKALKLGLEQNNQAEVGATNYIIASIYLLQGEYPTAIKICLETLTLFEKLGNRRYQSMILQTLSASYLRSNQLTEAQESIEIAIKIYREIEDRLGYGYALRQLGDIFKKMNLVEKSQTYWQEALQIARFLNHTHLINQLLDRVTN
ncbi:MAG: AAA family ATPase [Anaerolineales bacterium]|nr:AAA family ATPase [Anaerolineales bacterium]